MPPAFPWPQRWDRASFRDHALTHGSPGIDRMRMWPGSSSATCTEFMAGPPGTGGAGGIAQGPIRPPRPIFRGALFVSRHTNPLNSQISAGAEAAERPSRAAQPRMHGQSPVKATREKPGAGPEGFVPSGAGKRLSAPGGGNSCSRVAPARGRMSRICASRGQSQM